MNKWEAAKALLDSMVFPTQKFKECAKKFEEHRNGGTELVFGVETQPKSHKQKKDNHNGNRTKVSDLLDVNGFKTEFVRDYCFECRKVIKLEGIIFNDELNLCHNKIFVEDKGIPSPSDVFDGGLDL